MEVAYWRDRYKNVLEQNKKLNSEIQELNDAVENYRRLCNDQQQRIAELEGRLPSRHSITPGNATHLPGNATNSPGNATNSSGALLSPSQKNPMNSICGLSITIQKSIAKHMDLKKQLSRDPPSEFIPEMEDESLNIFENFFIIGTPDPQSPFLGPSVLFKFLTACNFDESILASFAFPEGFRIKTLDISESGSDFYSLLYRTHERDQHSFIFTIKSNRGSPSLEIEYANKNKELLFCCCVVTYEPIGFAPDEASIVPLIPKCYCLVSYYPCFDLHFKVLFGLLSIQKVTRMSDLSQSTSNFSDRQMDSLVPEQRDLLETYSQQSCLPNTSFTIELQTIFDIEAHLPSDFAYLDCDWACPALFTRIDFSNFFRLLSAFMLENSVVFVSENLDFLTSSVLGLQALMRPFMWPHLVSPLLPESLGEILEAPVPILAGVTKAPQNLRRYPHLIWVLLDETDPACQLVGLRMNEPHLRQLRESLEWPYKYFAGKSCYEEDNQREKCIHQIVDEVRSCWQSIIAKIPRRFSIVGDGRPDFEEIKSTIMERTSKDDIRFVSKMVETQYFINIIEEVIYRRS